MDDYFAEADEHLLTIRRCLLMLDGIERPDPSSSVLEELFRSCHSLKGISAMVELRSKRRRAAGDTRRSIGRAMPSLVSMW